MNLRVGAAITFQLNKLSKVQEEKVGQYLCLYLVHSYCLSVLAQKDVCLTRFYNMNIICK